MPESVDIQLFSPENLSPLPYEQFGLWVTLPTASQTPSDPMASDDVISGSVEGESVACDPVTAPVTPVVTITDHLDAESDKERGEIALSVEEVGGEEEMPHTGDGETESEGQVDYVYLSVFKWEERKGWDVLLKAFLLEFSSSDRVILILLTNAFHSSSDFAEKIVQVNSLAHSLTFSP